MTRAKVGIIVLVKAALEVISTTNVVGIVGAEEDVNGEHLKSVAKRGSRSFKGLLIRGRIPFFLPAIRAFVVKTPQDSATLAVADPEEFTTKG